MQLVDNLVKHVDVGYHFGAYWILKGVPRSIVFEKNRNTKEKNEVQEAGCQKHLFKKLILDAKMGGLK